MTDKGNLYDALDHMIERDGDYATTENSMGFNKLDTGFAHDLHNQVKKWGLLTEKQVKALSLMLRKYSKTQLSDFDLSYKNIDTRAAGTKKEAQKIKKHNRIYKVNNGIAVEFGFDAVLLKKVKSITGRQWDGERKRWLLPFTPDTYEAIKATMEGFEIETELADDFEPAIAEQKVELAGLLEGLTDDARRAVEYFASRGGQEMAINAALAYGRAI